MPRKSKEFTCIRCTTKFMSKQVNVRFCSRKCSGIYTAKTIKPIVALRTKVCKWCSKGFTDGRITKNYCSTKCLRNGVVDERRKECKRQIVEYKGGCCEKCGYNKSIWALHFHHKDPATKEFSLGSGSTISLDRLKKEADKCLLLCANCHAEIHEIEHERDKVGKRF